MFYFKTGNTKIEASFAGRRIDNDWDGRETKTITFTSLPLDTALGLFQDGLNWSIVEVFSDTEVITKEDGTEETRPVEREIEYSNADYNVFGSITKTFDNKIIVKMGKPTELEEAYEILYGGNA